MKLEPVAWMNDSKNIVTDRAKKSMMEQRHYGIEFAIAADTAERFDTPLYPPIPSGYVLVPVEMSDEAARHIAHVLAECGHYGAIAILIELVKTAHRAMIEGEQ